MALLCFCFPLKCLLAFAFPLKPPSNEQPPQVKFVDITSASGLHFHHHNPATSSKYLIETMTGGVAVFDYDNDGWMDVFSVNGACPCLPGAPLPMKTDYSPFEGAEGLRRLQWGCRLNWTTSSNKTVQASTSATHLALRAQGPSTPARKTEVKPAAAAKYRLAESLLQQGKAAEAIEALNAAIQLQPDFTEAHFVLGVILARQGSENYGAAVDQFLAALRLDPRHVDARINLSKLLEQEGDFEGAAGALKEALSLAGERADLYVMLGEDQRQAEKYSEAIQSFHRALELDPQVSGAHYGLGMTLRSLGDVPAARSEFELALKLNPDDVLAHYQLGRFLILQKEPLEAVRHLEESVRLKPDLADAYAKLGVVYKSVGKNEEAEKAFRTAVRLNPQMEKACYGLAQLLQAEGKTEEAQKVFEQVRQLKASSSALAEASSLNATGVVRMNAGELDEALEKFRAALTLNPAYAAAAYNQGLVLARQGKTTEAIQSFRTAVRLRPGFVLAHYGLGLVLRLAGDPAADEQLRKAQLMKRLVPQVGDMNRTISAEDPD